MARTREGDALEQRRREAAALLRQGVWPAEGARRLGVTRQSVSRWQAMLRENGRACVGRSGRGDRRRSRPRI